MRANHASASLVFLAAVWLALLAPASALAHCDGMDGPVVKAAQKALETGNVNLALIWIQKSDEAEIRKAFERTLAVRKLGAAAREMADLYFFETLVRVHRAGEGAPYTGLKPAGRDLGPAIPAADKAIAGGSAAALVELLTHNIRRGVETRFKHVMAAKKFAPNDVEAGRAYVKAYVEFIHYVEGLHQAGAGPAHGHAAEQHEH
ncbi:MAG: DUF6448 family protein [Acidobacteriota bacterium]